MRSQSSLGKFYYPDSPDMFMNGRMTVARVLKVHHKSGTADVVALESKDTVTSSSDNEGKYAAKILTNFGGYSEDRKKSWGSVSPIAVGTLVLLGFLDNMKSRPVILGQFHSPFSVENVLTDKYPLNEKEPGYNRREALKSLKVFPSMSYKKIDGESNIEFVHSSKSFLAMYNTSSDSQGNLTDAHNGFDHEHVSEKDPITGLPIETDFEEAKNPLKALFVHRSSFDNAQTKWTKFFLNEKGGFRLSRDTNDDNISYMEMKEDGSFKIRRQIGSPYFGEAENFTEMLLDVDGSLFFQLNRGQDKTSFGIDSEGNAIMSKNESYLEVGDNIRMEAKGELISDSVTRFIENSHIVASFEEPKNPKPGLVWIDLNDESE